jgi:hypothetical protein
VLLTPAEKNLIERNKRLYTPSEAEDRYYQLEKEKRDEEQREKYDEDERRRKLNANVARIRREEQIEKAKGQVSSTPG